jgi:hypothetical protein
VSELPDPNWPEWAWWIWLSLKITRTPTAFLQMASGTALPPMEEIDRAAVERLIEIGVLGRRHE